MTKKRLPKSSDSPTYRRGRVLQQALRAFDVKRHGDEWMAWSPVGKEVLPAPPAYEPDEGPLAARDVDALREMANAALPMGKVLRKRSLF